MQIKTTMPIEQIHELNIPFFRKKISYGTTAYIGVLPDETYVKIFRGPQYTNLTQQLAREAPTDLVDPYHLEGDWRICEEEDFLSFHMETLKSLSLEAVLVNQPAADPNDLKNINI